MLTLPCLSLRQPWAWLVACGYKDIENRKWNTKFRGTFLIHAAKGMTKFELGAARNGAHAMGFRGNIPEVVDRGGIIGAARLVDVIPPEGYGEHAWHMPGQFGFRLVDVTPLFFRPYKGALGFFRVELTPAEQDALERAGLLEDARRAG